MDFALFLSKNPNSWAIGLVGLSMWWAAGSAVAVHALLKARKAQDKPSPASQQLETKYAGFWRRVVAIVIDSVILMVGGMICGFIVGLLIGIVMAASAGDPQSIQAVVSAAGFAAGMVIGLFLNWLYFTLFDSSSKQATLGKMAIGIMVTDLHGNPISFGRANGRYWAKYVSAFILAIGYIMAGTTKRKQALHDMMAGTLVLKA